MADAQSQREQLQLALTGRYRIEQEIGAGGMATVYRAHDLRHRRDVAIKALRPELTQSVGADRFLREVEIAAGLQHPHIVPVFDSGQAAGVLWYAMPLVRGETLRERLTRTGALELNDVLLIAREVADALSHAHERGLVHRDIKPENIILSGKHALVLDFGIAKAISEAAGAQQLTQTGTSLGTVTYMAPEQAAGDPDVDHRADIYALGIVIYEMLAGRPPFEGLTQRQLLAAHVTQAPQPVTFRRPDTPRHVAVAVMRALAKEPRDRFESADAFASALLVPAAAGRGARRPRRWIAAALVLTIAAAVVAAALMLRRDARSSAASDAQRTRRLAVLPFRNLGNPDDAYFADGITDEIRGRLTAIPGLEIVASASSEAYRETRKTPAQIGEELGVQYLLTGRVRWARSSAGASRVQVSPELIAASSGTTRWQEPFDVTIDDIFAVQRQVAERVATALRVSLSSDRRELRGPPTTSVAAYDHFLRGSALVQRGRDVSSGHLEAIEELERAVALDPSFAVAYAELAHANAAAYWFFEDRTDARVRRARVAAERALALDPRLPDAHTAMGHVHYWGSRDYASALAAFDRALALAPNDPEALRGRGLVLRRMGRIDESARALVRVTELDPRDGISLREAGTTLSLAGRPLEALPYLQRQTELLPSLGSHIFHALALLKAGRPEQARRVLDAGTRTAAPGVVGQTYVAGGWWNFTPLHDVAGWRALEDVSLSAAIRDTAGYYLAKAEWKHITGDVSSARALADSAARVQGPLMRREPKEPRFPMNLAIAYALQGRRDEAVRAARKSLQMLPVSRDALDGASWIKDMAFVYVLLGDADAAIAEIERQLAMPSHFSAAYYRVDLRFRPLWSDARFQRVTGFTVR